jgi:threonylcarbamoyladenosine tRNA methylthiotransferase CDKAL1
VEILTYGCALNQADSHIIAALLRDEGLDESDLVIVNTCTVKSPTENKILKKLRQLSQEGRRVVVAGCIPAARPQVADEFPEFSFIGVNTESIIDAAKNALTGKHYVNIAESQNKQDLPCKPENPIVGIIPISEGCLGACSYCQTKHARGRLKSYPPKSILSKAKTFIGDGAREIWLTSQDTGAYGLDIGETLAGLLSEINELGGDFRVRVGMMNPNHALNMLDSLVEALSLEKIYRFAHIPVQSGDDGVLSDMNRDYTVKDYARIADALSSIRATVSTDIIAGYPTETDEAFNNTIRLMEKTRPDIINITRFWPRPNTPASRLTQLPGSKIKERSRILAEKFRVIGLKKNKGWVGWSGPALACERNRDGTYTARNDWYKPIIIPKMGLGAWSDVSVQECTHYDLRGSVLNSADKY